MSDIGASEGAPGGGPESVEERAAGLVQPSGSRPFCRRKRVSERASGLPRQLS